MKNFITNESTSLPIGKTGLFIVEDTKIEDLDINKVEYIAGSLYKLELRGMRVTEADETGRCSKTVWDSEILDMDDQETIPGYACPMSENLWAIFNVTSIDLGWPSYDEVIVKNIETKKRVTLTSNAPLDEEFENSDGLFVFKGSLFDYDKNKEMKRWRAFVDNNGKVIFRGFCWDYKITNKTLIIQRGRTSSKKHFVNFLKK
ncbi:MAG: hypothetical protein WC603_02660 [Candidatus Paceibacterota bacterium]|jgi:hypothetical protein